MDKHQRSRSNCKAGITVVWKYWCFSKIVKHDILSKTEKNVKYDVDLGPILQVIVHWQIE